MSFVGNCYSVVLRGRRVFIAVNHRAAVVNRHVIRHTLKQVALV